MWTHELRSHSRLRTQDDLDEDIYDEIDMNIAMPFTAERDTPHRKLTGAVHDSALSVSPTGKLQSPTKSLPPALYIMDVHGKEACFWI